MAMMEEDDMNEDMAAQWAAMLDEEDEEDEEEVSERGIDRVLNQGEIDNLLGFSNEMDIDTEMSGIRAIVDSAMVSYERLPMLEIIFDRFVRLTTTSLRNFTSDNVEVSLESISSVRFGDYINSIALPAILSVFEAKEWENFGIMTVDSNLIYSIIDVLLGGRQSGGTSTMRVEGRPYTTIEMNLVKQMVDVVIADAQAAFAPISQVTFEVDRLETNPRFAAICRPANAAIMVDLRIDMEDRGGTIQMLLPYATIEPIRGLLLQMFMGEKFGRDEIWEGHLATEVYSARTEVDAVLFEQNTQLSKVLNLKVGDTMTFDTEPSDPIALKVGDVQVTSGHMGQIDQKISVKLSEKLHRSKTTIEAFEKATENQGEGA